MAGPEQAQLFELWLSKLPLRADEIEAKVVHRQLVELVEASNPALIGAGFAKLPQVLSVMAALLESCESLKAGEPESLMDVDTRTRMVALVKMIQAQVPGPQVEAAWTTLTAPQQLAVQRSLA